MGVECAGEMNRYYSDLLFECGSPSHQFYILVSNQYNLFGDRHTCSESATITKGSSTSDIQFIPSVSIATDSLWQRSPILECVNMVDSILTAGPSVTPTVLPAVTMPVIPTTNVLVPVAPTFNSSPLTDVPVPVAPMFSGSPMIDATGGINSAVFAVVGVIVGGIIISLIVLFIYKKGKNDGNTNKYNNNTTGSQSNGSTDQLTQGNSDHLKRASDNTNGRFSSSAAGTSQSGTSASDVQSPGRLFPTKSATANAANAYIIDYKDQARSVDNAFPVMNSARRVDIGSAPFQNMPIATAVPMKNTIAAYQGTIVNDKKMPSDKATVFNV